MAPVVESHHHRSTTKSSHKPFKSKHASKNALRDLAKGKVEKDRGKRNTKPLHQQVMSKIERRHQARQKAQQKHKAHAETTSVFTGHHGAPRIVAVVSLTGSNNPKDAINSLNSSLGIEETAVGNHPLTVRVDRFKQNVQYIPVQKDLIGALDACRIADFVIFILSAQEEVDEAGEMMLKAIESQGVSNVVTVVEGLEKIEPPKKRPHVLTSLKSFICHFFPTQEKVHSLDNRQECSNVVRSLCTSTPKGIRWREDRSWMVVEDIEWPEQSVEKGTAVLTGVVRGRGLKADRLLHLGDLGDFQIEKIEAVPLPVAKKRKTEDMTVDQEGVTTVLEVPTAEQDDLDILAPEDLFMEGGDDMAISEAPIERKGVLLDDHHYFEDDESHIPDIPKRLPKGTSKYQSAWFLGDQSDSDSDWEDAEDVDGDTSMDGAPLPQDGMEGLDQSGAREPTEAAPSEYPQSEMFLDRSPNDEAEEIEAYRQSKREGAEDDLEFPDEIELHPNVLARERLSKYRGLKSLRTSHWETEEDKPYQPEEWNRLLQVPDYKAARSQATRDALVGGIQPGTKVRVFVKDVPSGLQSKANATSVMTAFSLLRHEHKYAAMNFGITLNSDHPVPLKAKEELIMQCGPRRIIIQPLFSTTGNTPNNVHKFDRYLHPGHTAMASFIGPMVWGSVPTLFFQRKQQEDETENKSAGSLQLVATGTSQAPSSNRVIAKRVILTGHPYKIHKKVVTVRYMFFNSEDVRWFKALQLWTRRGRSGYVKESLGTHGYFKATFDQKINPQDSIGVSLYKRMWPRTARELQAEELSQFRQEAAPELVVGGSEMQVD